MDPFSRSVEASEFCSALTYLKATLLSSPQITPNPKAKKYLLSSPININRQIHNILTAPPSSRHRYTAYLPSVHISTMLSRTLQTATRTLSRGALRPNLIAVAPRSHIAPLPAVTIVPKRGYHEKVLDHYSRPRNVGSMNKADLDVGTGLVGAPACGDVMKLQIRVDEVTGKISDVKFKTFGCGSAIASSSYLTELVRGMSLEDAGRIKNTEIAKELCLPPVKLHCSMLAEDAIKSAIKDYKSKRVGKPTLGVTA
ncbi:iron-binding protein [Orbilia blumenaviensis]|uniref:Iron-sulfur cluster assembly protein n=2 Tax=Orbiliaceae TaxID=47021 RepID=A0AAV9VL52_9PEZI